VDAIAEAIAADGGPPPAEQHPVALGTSTPEDEKAVADRIQTYTSLGKARDPRNVRFLRSALRTEKDPLLRSVVAEAIYLSDPDAGRRILVDTFEPTSEILGRLRSLTYHQDRPGTPVLDSVADIAAEGDPQALDRLLQATWAGREDVGLTAELAVTLVEVGRTAPDEVISALLRLDTARSGTVVRILGEGIRTAEPGPSPLHRALRARLEAETDAETRARLEAIRSELDLARQLAAQAKGKNGERRSPPNLDSTPVPTSNPMGTPDLAGGGG
jgi:D-alanyl-D-alanine carboxypeptidase/D-alanyl-D-alanine-endopeptidase (penicillin-binding protein 4)